MRTLTKLEVTAAVRNQLHRSEQGGDRSPLLTDEHCDRAILATADGRLANAPTVSVPVELFVPDGAG